MNKGVELISADFLFQEGVPEEKTEPAQEPQKPEPDLESILVALTDFSGLDAALSETSRAADIAASAPAPKKSYEPAPLPVLFDFEPEPSAIPEVVEGVRDSVNVSVSAPNGSALRASGAADAVSAAGSETSWSETWETGIPLSEQEKMRVDAVRNLRKELSDIFSESEGFPPFHLKTILSLVDAVCVRTVEKEIKTLWTLLLYYVETLGVVLDKEDAWERSRWKFLEAAYLRVKAAKGIGFRLIPKNDAIETPEVVNEAVEAFNSAYAKKREEFISELKRSWAVSSSPMRIDYSGNGWGKTVFACLEKTVSLWRRAYEESKLIGGDLLVLKIGNIMSSHYDNFSDVIKAAEEENRARMARNGVFVPKEPTKRKTIAIPVGQPIPVSSDEKPSTPLDEADTVPEEVTFSKDAPSA